MLGVLPTQEAKNLARGLELDLVEVNPKAMPPVCKVMDYGRFKYEEKKKQNEARKRQAQVELKEIKLRPKTDDHDLGFKIKHVRRFLEDGNKVKLTVRFRGREITHPETAERQIIAIIDAVVDIGTVEVPARMEGRTMTSILAPRGRPGGGASGKSSKPLNSDHRTSLRRVGAGFSIACWNSVYWPNRTPCLRSNPRDS